MAGSYKHIVDNENKFIGIDLIDNLGDAYEALEECHALIRILSGDSKQKIFEAHRQYMTELQSDYGMKMTFDDFWGDE